MKSQANGQLTDDFLKTLFISRLPTNIQSILTVSDQDIDNLAILADKVFEVTRGNEVLSVSSSKANDSSLSDLKRQIEELTKAVHFLRNNRSYSRGRGGGGNRGRSKTPNRSDSDKNMCWYHNRFGEKATKCREGCTYVKSKN